MTIGTFAVDCIGLFALSYVTLFVSFPYLKKPKKTKKNPYSRTWGKNEEKGLGL
jgi:hypothetical protein